MEPTLDAGDGFVAVPPDLAGPIDEGDVVVFEAEQLGGGGLTTHRIVGETDRGYLTQGDANNAIDQQSGEPPVPESQIVAEALQIDGHIIVIPHLGDAVEGSRSVFSTTLLLVGEYTGLELDVQTLLYLLFGASVLLYVADGINGSGRTRGRDRSRATGTDSRVVLVVLVSIVLLGATAAMVVPGGTQEYGLISSNVETPTVVTAGDSTTRTYPLRNTGLLATVSFLEPESEDLNVRPRRVTLESGERLNATVTLRAPERTGYYRYYLTEYRYLALLPTPAIETLHRVHPWLPIVAIDALLGGTFYLLGVTLVGTGRVRSRSRETAGPSGRLLNRFL